MNLRHAAALALVGWYLMTPPLFLKEDVNWNAPPSEWDRRQAFDTANGCESAKDDLVRCGAVLNDAVAGTVKQACGFDGKTRSQTTDKKQADIVAQMAVQYMEARCIATDDPGLHR